MWTSTNVFWLSIGCVLLGWGLHQYWLRFERWRARRRLRKAFRVILPNIVAAMPQVLAHVHELLREEAENQQQEHDHQEHDHHGTTH